MIDGGIEKHVIQSIVGWIVFLLISVIMLIFAFKVQNIKDVKDGVDLQVWMWFYSLFTSILVGGLSSLIVSAAFN